MTQARSWGRLTEGHTEDLRGGTRKDKGAQSSFPHETVHRLGSQIIKSKDWNKDGEIKEKVEDIIDDVEEELDIEIDDE